MAKDVVYDLDAAAFSSDEFRMYQFKVRLLHGGAPAGAETAAVDHDHQAGRHAISHAQADRGGGCLRVDTAPLLLLLPLCCVVAGQAMPTSTATRLDAGGWAHAWR
jgi:hypothetical protein